MPALPPIIGRRGHRRRLERHLRRRVRRMRAADECEQRCAAQQKSPRLRPHERYLSRDVRPRARIKVSVRLEDSEREVIHAHRNSSAVDFAAQGDALTFINGAFT